MPTRVASREPVPEVPRRAILVPLPFLASAALLTVLLYRWFEAALAVLAPLVLGLCMAAAVGGVAQRAIAARRARRRELTYLDVGRILDEVAGGGSPDDVARVGASWRSLDAARRLVGSRPRHEQAAIHAGMRASGAWKQVARRADATGSKWERVRAIQDLGWLGTPEATPAVLRALNDEDDDVGWAAIAALGGMEHDLAYQILLDLLDDSRFSPSRIAQVLDTSRHPRPVPLLLARSEVATPRTLFWIAYLLGRSGEAQALPALRRLARHADANVRAAAAEGLGRLGERAASPTLLRMLNDDAWFVRLHAARSLGDLRTRRAVGPLRAATGDPAWWVRRSATDALRRIVGDAA